MKFYQFQVIINGLGDTPEEAWLNATEGIAADGLGPFEADLIIYEEEVNE